MSRLLASLATVALVAGLAAPAAAQQQRPRTIVLWIDAITLADMQAPNLPAFRELLAHAAAGTMSTQPVDRRADPATALAAAADALGNGRLAPHPPADQAYTALGAALTVYGLPVRIISGSPEDLPSAASALGPAGAFEDQRAIRADAQYPGRVRTDTRTVARSLTDALEASTVLLIHLPDVLLAERALPPGDPARASWVALTMRRADELLATILEQRADADRLIVVSPTATGPRRAAGLALGALVITGPAFPAGTLRSATTLRDGHASVTDVAGTVLARYGISRDEVDRIALARLSDPPPGLAGHPIDAVPDADGVARARRLEADLIGAARAHGPATRSFTLVALGLLALATLTILAERGRPPATGRLPRGWRDLVATTMTAVAALPGAALLEAAWAPGGSARVPLVWIIALAAALGLRAAAGRARGVAFALAGSAFLVVADLFAGGALAARATLPLPIADGMHARAFEPVALGTIVAGIAGLGMLLDRERQHDAMPAIVLAAGALAVAAVGTSGAGGDVGAAIALTPAVVLLALVAAGAHPGRRAAVGTLATTIAAAGMLALTYGLSLWVHLDPVVPMRGVPGIADLRLDQFVRQLTGVWLPAVVVPAGVGTLLLARRRSLVGRGLWGRPHLRIALTGGLVAALLAPLTVAGGLAAAGTIAILGGTAALVPMIAPD